MTGKITSIGEKRLKILRGNIKIIQTLKPGERNENKMSAIKRYAEDLMGEEGFEEYLDNQMQGDF